MTHSLSNWCCTSSALESQRSHAIKSYDFMGPPVVFHQRSPLRVRSVTTYEVVILTPFGQYLSPYSCTVGVASSSNYSIDLQLLTSRIQAALLSRYAHLDTQPVTWQACRRSTSLWHVLLAMLWWQTRTPVRVIVATTSVCEHPDARSGSLSWMIKPYSMVSHTDCWPDGGYLKIVSQATLSSAHRRTRSPTWAQPRPVCGRPDLRSSFRTPNPFFAKKGKKMGRVSGIETLGILFWRPQPIVEGFRDRRRRDP